MRAEQLRANRSRCCVSLVNMCSPDIRDKWCTYGAGRDYRSSKDTSLEVRTYNDMTYVVFTFFMKGSDNTAMGKVLINEDAN